MSSWNHRVEEWVLSDDELAEKDAAEDLQFRRIFRVIMLLFGVVAVVGGAVSGCDSGRERQANHDIKPVVTEAHEYVKQASRTLIFW